MPFIIYHRDLGRSIATHATRDAAVADLRQRLDQSPEQTTRLVILEEAMPTPSGRISYVGRATPATIFAAERLAEVLGRLRESQDAAA